jgi:hypothetical protein
LFDINTGQRHYFEMDEKADARAGTTFPFKPTDSVRPSVQSH